MERRLIFKYIVSILVTFNFLIIGSLFWYNLHNTYEKNSLILNNMQSPYYIDEIKMNNITKCSSNDTSKLPTYKITLENNDINEKKYYIKLINDYYNISNNSKKITNNYIKYMIKDSNGNYSEVHSLNMNGDLYFDTINSKETKIYELKVWVSDNYLYDDTFNGNIMILYA